MTSTAAYQQQYTAAEQEMAFVRLAILFLAQESRSPQSWRGREAKQLKVICWRVMARLHSEQRRGMER